MNPPLRLATILHNVATDPERLTLDRIHAELVRLGVQVTVISVGPHERPVLPCAVPRPDVALVIGGDGTMLRAVRAFCESQTPLVGINCGNLGFLARVDAEQVSEGLQRLASGQYALEERLMLRVSAPAMPQEALALNDAMVKSENPSQMGSFRLFINETPVAAYDADGVIIATPTGSTAYTVSAGGPVISPEAAVIAITPICPHSLSNRPIVVPCHNVIRIEAASAKARLRMALDGMDAGALAPGESMTVARAPVPMRFVSFHPGEEDFYWRLKTKLHWARNPRGRTSDADT